MRGFIVLEYGPIDEGYDMGDPQGFEDLVAGGGVEVGYVEARYDEICTWREWFVG